MSVLNEDEFVLLTESNGEHFEYFNEERRNNVFTEILWKQDEEMIGKKSGHGSTIFNKTLSTAMIDVIKKSKRIKRLQSLGLDSCLVIGWKLVSQAVHNEECGTYKHSMFLLNLKTNEISYLMNKCIRRDGGIYIHPSLHKHIRQHELHCRILHGDLQCKQELVAFERRCQIQTATNEKNVSLQFDTLRHDLDKTNVRLDHQMSKNEHLQNEFRATTQTLQDIQTTTTERMNSQTESLEEWKACVMDTLKQHEISTCALQEECKLLREQMHHNSKDTEWISYICICFSVLFLYYMKSSMV
jgi:hypothetical protein